MTPPTRTIQVDVLARVEGEGALRLKIADGAIAEVALEIFEPPRFFEAFLRGRHFMEAPDLTARICGICPIAYQISAINAMERALGVQVPDGLRQLRRLIYAGEWLESHALHVTMLHAPDFLGYPSALHMAKDHPGAVERGLALKRLGNDLMTLVGGRAVHPVNLRVGGFHHLPSRAQVRAFEGPLKAGLEQSLATVEWVRGFSFPDFDRPVEKVALTGPDGYAVVDGRLRSTGGLDLTVDQFEDHVEEHHVERSHALHATLKGRGSYLVGPVARYALNRDRLAPAARAAADAAGLGAEVTNPFRSILVRSVELVQACEDALDIVTSWTPPDEPFVEPLVKAARGEGWSEAPRGLIYHRYELDAQGLITQARIVPPTSQNQRAIELDLREFAGSRLHLADEDLRWQCEQVVRNHDPCISCATHFLKLIRETA